MAANEIPLRIRIGVTGHRSYHDADGLARSVKATLRSRIFELFDPPPPAGLATPLSFTVLTSLAEGADRLVATEVMEFPDSEITAVLPYAADEYQESFTTPEAQKDFWAWLDRAGKSVILRPGVTKASESGIRKAAYEAAGRFVVDNCDLLIALWDGREAQGRGGTAEIVAYARSKNRPLVIVSTLDPENVRIERGNGLSGRALERVAYFNGFPLPEATIRTYVDNLYRALFENREGGKIPETVRSWIRERLLPWYARASMIAKQNQKMYNRAGLAVYALTPLAVAAVAIGILVHGWSFGAFLIEFVLLMAVYIIIRIAGRRKVHDRWIETRFLTENLRAAVFLFSCGSEPSGFVFPPLARTVLRDDEWIQRLFDEIMRRAGRPAGCPQIDVKDHAEFIRIRWVGKQIEFHEKKKVKAGKISGSLEIIGQGVFLAAIVAAASHIALRLMGYQGLSAWLENPAAFLAVVLPAVGAAVGGIRSHREYSRLEKRSRSMEAVLKDLDQRYASVADADALKALLQETELLMLQETQDWLVLMKSVVIRAV